jgi:hypothetical protein
MTNEEKLARLRQFAYDVAIILSKYSSRNPNDPIEQIRDLSIKCSIDMMEENKTDNHFRQ